MSGGVTIVEQIRRLVRQPGGEISRAQRTLRYLVDFGRHCATTLARDRAPQMAAALTYRTIFSLVPTLVLTMIVFSNFSDTATAVPRIKQSVYGILNIEALSGAAIQDAAVGETAPLTTDELAEQADRQAESRQLVSDMIDGYIAKAQNLSFKGIGIIGLLVLIWAALALVITVEQCFNRVYNAQRGRPWHQKIMIYWALLTLGPVLVTVSTHLAGQFTHGASDMPLLGDLLKWAGRFTALGATWLLLFLLYVLMPATRVHLRPAVIGSFIAAVLWELAKGGFKLYVAKASFTSVYGSLGLVPLFLFWLYLSWLIVLFGLEISYSLQTLGGYRIRERQTRIESQLVGDPLWLVRIMTHVARAFADGGSMTTQALSQELGLPERTVGQINSRLEEAGLLHRVQGKDGEDAGYALGRPPDHIRLAQLLELGHSINTAAAAPRQTPGQAWLDKIIQAQMQAAGQATLADAIK